MATKYPPPSPPFIRARFQGGRQTPKAIVIHGTVTPDNPGTARGVANWWHGPTSPVTSAHYVVDPKETIQCVGDHSVAYHCGYNTGSIAIELCDEQVGPASRWKDADSVAILARAARLTAQLCLAYGIAAFRPTIASLKAKGPHGIYGHNDSRLAFGNTSHSDPRDFDWPGFLRLVRREIAEIKGGKPKPDPKPQPKPEPENSFKILHAPLHGNSATNVEMLKALSRPGVVGVAFSEAYKHGRYLSSRPGWRGIVGSPEKDSRGRMCYRDVILMVRKYRHHLEEGWLLGCKPSKPEKIAPARYVTWTVDNLDGKPLAMVSLHPHAAVRNAWTSRRARQYRRGMKKLVQVVESLREKYGKDLDIVVLGDFNYPDQQDGRKWAPRQVFARLDLNHVSRGLDWVAHSAGLRRVSTTVIDEGQNGQDHPWIEAEFVRR